MPFVPVAISPAMAQVAEQKCACPMEDAEAALSCLLRRERIDKYRGCFAYSEDGFPRPVRNLGKPNVYRDFTILGATEGDPYKGMPTRIFKVRFDYVGRLLENDSVEPRCEKHTAEIVMYFTQNGWKKGIQFPAGEYLPELIKDDEMRLDKAYAKKDIYSVSTLSTRLANLNRASRLCQLLKR
jgi:hypothetical protein